MKPNPAMSLILLGLGAALRRRRGASRALRMASILAALVVLAVGIMTLAEYALSMDLHIDGLVASDPSGHYPGRMSPPTAVALCLLASALLVFDVRPTARARPSEWISLSAGFVAFVALLGQAFGAGPIYRLPSTPVAGVSVPAAVALFMIATGCCSNVRLGRHARDRLVRSRRHPAPTFPARGDPGPDPGEHGAEVAVRLPGPRRAELDGRAAGRLAERVSD
jgi:hypothetical protein